MGLFSKSKRSVYDSGLDVPPMPPPGLKSEFSEISDIDEELPKFDEIPKPGPDEREMLNSFKQPKLEEEQIDELGDLPELPPLDKFEPFKEESALANFDFKPKEKRGFFGNLLKKKSKQLETKLPSIQDFSLGASETKIPDDLAEFPELPPLPEEPETKCIEDSQLFPQEQEELKEVEEKPIKTKFTVEQKSMPKFINIIDFKEILFDMKKIKTELNSFDQAMESFEEHKTIEERLFKKWRNSLKDIEKKLQFTEKILFKG